MLPGTVDAPGANRGKSGTAVVAEVPAPDRPPGRTLRQRETTKGKDGVKLTAPLPAQALIDEGGKNSPFDTCKAPGPRARVSPGDSNPRREGRGLRARRTLPPVEVEHAEVAKEETGPPFRAGDQVVQEPEQGGRTVHQKRAKKPQTSQGKSGRHVKPARNRKYLGLRVAALGGVTVRHGHRTAVAPHQSSLQGGEVACGEGVPSPHGVAEPGGG